MMPTVALLTGTYGTEVQNGVGRFLLGLHQWSLQNRFPLEVFSAGDHLERYRDVREIHSLSFAIPGGYSAIRAYYPLEGQRKQLRRTLRTINPDLVHVSTPEAIGATAVKIALKQKRPLVGIYHTDFPAFIGKLVREELLRLSEDFRTNTAMPNPLKPWFDRAVAFHRSHTPLWERWLFRFLWRRFSRRSRRELQATFEQGLDRFAQQIEAAIQQGLRQFYRHFDLVIARSETSRQALIRDLNLPESRVQTLISGVDPQRFHPQPQPLDAELRSRFGISPTAKVLLYVGRVTDEKNVWFLAKAWREFQSRTKQSVQFVVVGSGQIDRFREEAGRGAITLGPQTGDTLSGLYRMADLFWTASPHETLGQVVLEAMASGVPVLVSNSGAAQENVREGETGRILALADPGEWAQALEELFAQPEQLRTQGEAARRTAETRSIEASYQHFWSLHAEVVRKPDPGSVRSFPIVAVPDPPLPEFRGAPSVHLSDFHAGKRRKRIPKEAALRAACERARDRKARCFLQGDFLDTRPALQKLHAEIEMIRRTFTEFGIKPIQYLEGNHDYEFGRAGEIEELIGTPVAKSLVHRDEETGLVLTHGHISELPELNELLSSDCPHEELVNRLSIESLKPALRLSALRYDLVTSLTNLIEQVGLEGLEEGWRSSLKARRKLASWLSQQPGIQRHNERGMQALLHMIGSSDRERILGELCHRLGGWGLVYGHTHEPHLTLQSLVDPRTGQRWTVLLGNSGSFCRKSIPPTWIEAEFPAMELWCYDSQTRSAQLMERLELPPADQANYAKQSLNG
jgi:glycosyltransferase involved in cell wall biosynthesis/predicted phosphodiesterase